MVTYGIYRIGSNAANQSMCNRALVAQVEAKNRTEAVRAAHGLEGQGRFTLYANQRLEAVPASRISQGEWAALAEQEILEFPACVLCGREGTEKIERWRAAFWQCDKCR